MRLTRFVKTLLYAAFSLPVIWWAVWTVEPLYGAEDPVEPYLRSDILLFIGACVLTGLGVYTWLAFTRRDPEHRADTLFFLIFGLLLLAAAVGIILRFGGLTRENFDPEKAAMINLNLMLAGALPLPVLVRGWILVPGCEKGIKRAAAAVAVLVPTVVYLLQIVTGRLLHTVSYTG